MTTRDVVHASGISWGTVYAHLRNGTLRGEQNENGRWHVDLGEFLQWEEWAWSSGRFLMHSPSWAQGYLEFTGIKE